MIWQSGEVNLSVIKKNDVYITKKDKERHKQKHKFKVNNSTLISLVLIGFISLCAGVGTYSWFTSSAVSGISTISLGTLNINIQGGQFNENALIFEGENLYPGVPTETKTIYFTNEGSLESVFSGALRIDSANKEKDDLVDTNSYKIIADIYKCDSNNNIIDPNTNRIVDIKGSNIPAIHFTSNRTYGETIGEFNAALLNEFGSNNYDGKAIVFSAGQKLLCKFQLVVDPTLVTNKNQGDKLTGIFEVKARQNVNEAKF